MDDDGRAQQYLPVAEAEPRFHVKAELRAFVAKLRIFRDAYKKTRAIQSMMPSYRRSTSFSRIRVPDELFGHYSSEGGGDNGAVCACVLESDGEVAGARLPSGAPASEEGLAADAAAWATSFARDQRVFFVQNHHNRECTATCVQHLQGQQAIVYPTLTWDLHSGRRST
ncbi:unnamed protein product [Prorocentrum cordatum]|uniref:Uncharacterized protein n=1 Tax=Prorocentrum cordatum TaxID=2364126 RepID=A0ABN9WS85_9DINO|nr:unnamed protein product [Polarella glacialis]